MVSNESINMPVRVMNWPAMRFATSIFIVYTEMLRHGFEEVFLPIFARKAMYRKSPSRAYPVTFVDFVVESLDDLVLKCMDSVAHVE
jgi:hypothetical protein